MEFITTAVAWVLANQTTILTAVVAAHGAALAVVNLTPTPKDNAVLEKVYSVISFFAGLVTKEAQGTKDAQ